MRYLTLFQRAALPEESTALERSHLGRCCPPGHIGHCRETSLVFTRGVWGEDAAGPWRVAARDAATIPRTHRTGPAAQTWPRMSMSTSIALRLRNTAPHHRRYRWWFYTADCQQVSPQPLFYQRGCQRESINPPNIWNEIPTAKLLWKAVTCW